MVDDAAGWSVEAQRADAGSMLSLHRRLLALRRAEPGLHAGAWSAVDGPDGVVAFDRTGGGARFRILLNLRPAPVAVSVDGRWSVALSTHLDRDDEPVANEVLLRADEGLVLRLGAA
jgi:alpha-glucosidase